MPNPINQYISRVKIRVSRKDKFSSDEVEYDEARIQAPSPKIKWYARKSTVYSLILALMGFCALFSLSALMNQSLRLDEAQSMWQASQNLKAMLNTVGQDVHVPLYHILLHYWQAFFGNSVAVVRLPSLTFYLLTIPASYMLGKAAFGEKVGIFSAALVALSPFLNWYGSEARMYSMLLFFGVLNQYFFVKIFSGKPEHRKKRGAWRGYFFTGLAGVYTHYFFWLQIFSQAVFFFMARKEFPKKSLGKFAAIVAAYFIALLPWLIFVFHLGGAANTQPLLPKPSSIDLFNTFSQFIFGFQRNAINTVLVSLWPIAVLLAFFALRKDRRAVERRKIPPFVAYLLIAAFVPVLTAFTASIFVKPIYLSRYLVFAIPPLFVFFGWLLFARYAKRLSAAIMTALVLLMGAGLANQTVSASTPVKENYRQVDDYLNAHAAPSDIIAVSAPFTIYPLEYYYTGDCQISTLPIWDRYAHGPIPAFRASALPGEVSKLIAGHQNIWLVLSYDQGYNAAIKLYFDTHFQRLYDRTFSPGLSLMEYKVTY